MRTLSMSRTPRNLCLQLSSVQFNENEEAAYEFHTDDNSEQGTAFAITNTAVEVSLDTV